MVSHLYDSFFFFSQSYLTFLLFLNLLLRYIDSSRKDRKNEYDVACKFRYIYDCIIHNCNYFTKHASMDLCIDETTWGFGGHGGSIVGNLINKQKNRGGQSVLLLDVGTMLPRRQEGSYIARKNSKSMKNGTSVRRKFEG